MLKSFLLAETTGVLSVASSAAFLRAICPQALQQSNQTACRRQSGQAASTSGPPAPSNVPEPVASSPPVAGRGFGFQTRFKEMTNKELATLLRQTEKAGGAKKLTDGPVKMARPAAQHDTGQFAAQWTRLPEGITKPYAPQDINKVDIFAVIEAGPTQFKVGPDDKIFLHRLNGVDINDRISFNRVLLCGTPADTLIGRPFLPGVTVTAAVEEHIRDSTVYIYKRRRAKGYRRFRGFRAELTGVRILGIHGSETLGVPAPVWEQGISTPLHATPTLGQKVRLRRKQKRSEERAHDRKLEDDWLDQRRVEAASDAAVFETRSYPLSPADLQAASDASAARATARAAATSQPGDADGGRAWRLEDDLGPVSSSSSAEPERTGADGEPTADNARAVAESDAEQRSTDVWGAAEPPDRNKT